MKQLLQPVDIELCNYANLLDAKLSTEGIDVLTHIPEFFTNKLYHLVNFFKKTNAIVSDVDVRKYSVYFKDLDNARRKITLAKNNITFINVKRRIVPSVIGINVDVLTLARNLKDSNDLISSNLIPMLEETRNTIGRLVTDSGYRLSSRPVNINKKYTGMVDSLNKNLTSVTSNKSVADNKKVVELAPSIMHIVESANIAITYGNTTTVDFYKEIQKEVDTISSYADSLYKSLVDDGNTIKKKRVQEIAKLLDISANAVTQAINTIYLSTQSAILITNLVNVVTKDKNNG